MFACPSHSCTFAISALWSRAFVAAVARKDYEENNLVSHGAYELVSDSDAKVSIFASGSEVEIALKAAADLKAKGISTRVVSVPCFELFMEQPETYREAIIGTSPVKIGVEAARRAPILMCKAFLDPVAVKAEFVEEGRSGASQVVNSERLQR